MQRTQRRKTAQGLLLLFQRVAAPVVIDQVQTKLDYHWVKKRHLGFTAMGFDAGPEVTTRKCYYVDGTPVATHENGTLHWLFGNHPSASFACHPEQSEWTGQA